MVGSGGGSAAGGGEGSLGEGLGSGKVSELWWELGIDVGWLAIASPKPPKIARGRENSASQCSPLTQLNRAIPPYKPKKHIAQNRIGSHPILIKAHATANRAIPNN